MTETTLVLLKPDALARGLSGRILARLEDAGLKIVGARMAQIDDALARDHYDDLEERIGTEAFAGVCRYMQSGPVIALAIQGCDAVPVVRKLIGATFPSQAAPGTIRGDLCHHGARTVDGQAQTIYNLVHASGSPEEAEREVALWFGPDELFAYARLDEGLTF